MYFLLLTLGLVPSFLIRASLGQNSPINNTSISNAFQLLNGYSSNANRGLKPSLGGQNHTQCCLSAFIQTLQLDDSGDLVGLRNTSDVEVGSQDLTAFQALPFPCGATYSEGRDAAPSISVSYKWCTANCSGWQLAKRPKLKEWVGPFVGFIVPAVVFCLAVPRRRKLYIWEKLFHVPINEITSNFRTPVIALAAALLVTIDTISWLMATFALSGPMLVSGIYEAYIDSRILAFVQDKIKNVRNC